MEAEILRLIRECAVHAVACEAETGAPCELTMAQWALESGWGQHQPGNNCFGIKGDAANGQLLTTTEWFGPVQAENWLMGKEGRTAVLLDGVPPDSKGRCKYACRDWFRMFNTLTDCFIDHASIFQRGMYANFLGTYKINGNLVSFVHNIAPIYATDPDYSKSLLSIMSMPEVQAAIIEARRG